MRGTIAAAAVLLAACAPAAPGFGPRDVADIRALEEAYRTAWLANDSAAVMATLAPDAVLMPAAMQPIAGDSAIRSFWWPADGSSTTIRDYRLDIDEVEGSGDLAFVRGRGTLAFTYRDAAGEVSEVSSRAVHLSVVRRGEGGRWHIARRAWSPLR